MSEKQEINEYLFYEFGFDVDEGDIEKVSDDWPFILNKVGIIDIPSGQMEILEFKDEQEEYFVVSGSSLTYYPKAGMGLDDLRLQHMGASWMEAHDPVDLETCILGENSPAGTLERRKEILHLTKKYFAKSTIEILEGLYLRKTKEYISLVITKENDQASVVGSNFIIRNVPFPEASPWRRVAVGIGKLVDDGRFV